MKKACKNYIKSCEISEVAEVVLGGYKQKIAEPGSPVTFSVGCRGMFPELTDKAVMVNSYRGNKSLWEELVNIDLTKELQKVGAPYKILQGENDLITPVAPLIEAVKDVENSNLTFKIVPKSGHMSTEDAMQIKFDEIYQMVYGL